MKIHEYQAKELFKKYNVLVPEGGVALKPDEAAAIAKKLANYPVVVKAQIHAGGRGKGGGVKLAQSADEVQNIAKEIIGMTLVTHQTGPEGRLVKKVLVEQGLNIEKELYLSIIPDRASAQIVVMASEAGGMDIEKVAAKTPERIIKVHINPLLGIQSYHCRGIGEKLMLASFRERYTHGIRKVRSEADRPKTIRWLVEHIGYRVVGTAPKRHAFGSPDIEFWTVLELDLIAPPDQLPCVQSGPVES